MDTYVISNTRWFVSRKHLYIHTFMYNPIVSCSKKLARQSIASLSPVPIVITDHFLKWAPHSTNAHVCARTYEREIERTALCQLVWCCRSRRSLYQRCICVCVWEREMCIFIACGVCGCACDIRIWGHRAIITTIEFRDIERLSALECVGEWD